MDNKIFDKKIEPQLIPFKCVVCNGFGTLKWGQLTCHACGGRGYILIPNSRTSEIDIAKEKENNEDSKF